VPDTNEFVLDDTDGANQSGGTLRQKLEQAVALLNQFKAENEALKSEKTNTVIKSAWDELQVPEFYRGLYNGDKTPDAIKTWWEASKGFFNIEANEEAPAGQEQETEQQREHREAAERYQEATSLGSDALTDSFDAVTAKAKQAAKSLSGADLAAAKAEYYRATQLAEY